MKRAPVDVSIAMTTYSGETHLQEQLNSLAKQHLLPAELVVGDDGSTDNTLDILECFARNAPFPVGIHRIPQRLGCRANFMNVARLCTSSLISFCEQDESWLAENLARVVPCCTDPDVLLTFRNAWVVDAQRQPISHFYAEPLPPISRRLTLSPWMFSYGFTQTFRANLLPAADYWGLITEYRPHAGNTIGSGKRTKPGFVDRCRYGLEDRSDTYRYLGRIAPIDAELFAHLQRSRHSRLIFVNVL